MKLVTIPTDNSKTITPKDPTRNPRSYYYLHLGKIPIPFLSHRLLMTPTTIMRRALTLKNKLSFINAALQKPFSNENF